MSTNPEPRIPLRKPLERTIGRGHPWIYREALDPSDVPPGEVVTVVDRRGRFLARGFAEGGPIGVRVLTTRDEPIDGALFGRRIRQAAELRDRVVPPRTTAYRLLHGEGDRLPGVVLDVYGSHGVLRLDGQGIERWLPLLLTSLEGPLRDRGVEHLLLRRGPKGARTTETLRGQAPDGPIVVEEHGMKLLVDLVHGQKTGLFLDHRESRHRVRALARGAKVLNLYGYTGGFSVSAGLGGASRVTTVDVAPAAIALAQATWEANKLGREQHEGVAEDVPTYLGRLSRTRSMFDVVVADPPSFAPNEAALPKALASYRALHASCLALLPPGGLYLAASCSSHVDGSAFEETLREGASQAGRVLQVLDRWGAPPDHPRLLAFPEGDYLKVILARLLS